MARVDHISTAPQSVSGLASNLINSTSTLGLTSHLIFPPLFEVTHQPVYHEGGGLAIPATQQKIIGAKGLTTPQPYLHLRSS
ncbi:hypothetical protein E2C01_080072 [Portunus trituberculatus]|uniref:Uncharacterized protein n=1 Tax=Portunus trituberculatus TaxID=210409 RepID=A0A5B7ISF8_PORTR|nr:hypothetical protein [Portunus trituberculatus]